MLKPFLNIIFNNLNFIFPIDPDFCIILKTLKRLEDCIFVTTILNNLRNNFILDLILVIQHEFSKTIFNQFVLKLLFSQIQFIKTKLFVNQKGFH